MNHISGQNALRRAGGPARPTAALARREAADRKLFLAVMQQELRAPLDVIATCAEEALRRHWDPAATELLTTLIARVQDVAHKLAEIAEASHDKDASGSFPKPIEVAELCLAQMAEAIAEHRARSRD